MVSGMTKVSVIIPIYNGESDLPDLVDCLLAQTLPTEQVEYLLVDNASRDRTPILIQSAMARATAQGMILKYLLEDQIQSSYAARNRGIRVATGEILAFTDADCRPQAAWLEKLMEPFTDPAIGLVAGEILALPGDSLLEQFAEHGKTLSQKHTLAHPFCPYGQTANLAIRRDVLESVGLFRPYLTTGGDADLCWRVLRQTNWRIHFASGATVQHRHRATWKDLMAQWRRYGRSNRYLHDLHGVALQPEWSNREYLYRYSRWLLKELPIVTVRLLMGKATRIDLVSTPLSLACGRARLQGQREAQLPEAAREIAPFEVLATEPIPPRNSID
ncbi:glycosyltransferase [Leptolyngbya sp. 'hensonii']|nr:glycosyltransferase [Leptolyngbya sp. 'hensonii']